MEPNNALENIIDLLNNGGSVSRDKYDNKAIRFYDKSTHYELIFTDEFYSTSKFNPVITDILLDLKDADKTKELHIFINSIGGDVTTLSALIQQIKEFEYVVTIVMGDASSAGFMLWCIGNERYCSKYSNLMYHACSTFFGGKINELNKYSSHIQDNMDIITKELKLNTILKEEEIKEGELTEIWISGNELIKRKCAIDFTQYKNRKIIKGEIVMDLGEIILRKNDQTNLFDTYVKYEEARSFTYSEVRQLLMKDSIKYEDILKPTHKKQSKKAAK